MSIKTNYQLSIVNYPLKLALFLALGMLLTACQDPEPPYYTKPVPPVDKPTDTVRPVDTFSLDYDGPGWGRLEGVPLLGYGQPVDRRAEARPYIEAARQKLRELGWDYDYTLIGNPYRKIREIGLFYPDMFRSYENAKLRDFQEDFYSFIQTEALTDAYDYLSDTVVLFMGGGPDYAYGTHIMYLYEGTCPWDYCQDVTDKIYIPATSKVLSRNFNLPHTSIIEVPHATAGTYDQHNRIDCNVKFFPYEIVCGSFQAEWPNNILSYEDAGLLNDISVELLRWVVQHLKSLGKTLVFHGYSWGSYVFGRYLLYYPIADFARVDLFAFNPNNYKEHIINDRLGINRFYKDSVIILGQEVYEMCRWRMVNWMVKQNLDRLRILTGGEDDNGGFPLPNDIKALTDAGATVVELVGLDHGCIFYEFSKYGDTVASQPWENNMKIYTKHGVEIIQNADIRKYIPYTVREESKTVVPLNHHIGAKR